MAQSIRRGQILFIGFQFQIDLTNLNLKYDIGFLNRFNSKWWRGLG